MPTDIGVHDLTSNTSHSPFVASSTQSYFANPTYLAFDDATGSPSFWIGQNGGVEKLQLDRGNANFGFDLTPHDLTSDTSHSPIVISASSNFGGFEEFRALDGSTSSYWVGTGSGVDWWKIDWGSGNSHIIKSYWLRMNSVPEPNRAPKNWTFEGSNDGTTWTTLHTVTGQTSWDSAETRYFEPTDISTAYRYHRINITANNGDASFTQLGEVYLFDVPQDRTRSKVLGSYKVKVATTAARAPKTWTIEGNKHEGGGWVTLDTQASQTAWGSNEERTFTCAAGGSTYEGFRLNITANNGDGTYTEVAELTLYEATATTVDESISLGVTAGPTFTPAAQAAASLAVGVSAATTPAAPVTAVDALEIDVALGTSVAGSLADQKAIAAGVSLGFSPLAMVNAEPTIALEVGVDVAFDEDVHFGQVRRGKTAVMVTGAGSGKATVR